MGTQVINMAAIMEETAAVAAVVTAVVAAAAAEAVGAGAIARSPAGGADLTRLTHAEGDATHLTRTLAERDATHLTRTLTPTHARSLRSAPAARRTAVATRSPRRWSRR